jgi:translation initiation factor IF-2
MSDGNDQTETKGRLSLRPVARGDAGHTVDAGSVRQSFSHGRSKVVQVEVRKKRGLTPGGVSGAPASEPSTLSLAPSAKAEANAAFDKLTAKPAAPAAPVRPTAARPAAGSATRALTAAEIATRQRVLTEQQRIAAIREAERREQEKISILSAAEVARRREEEEAIVEARRADEPQPAAPEAGTETAVPSETTGLAPATDATPAAVRSTATPAATAETLRLKPGGRPASADDDEDAPRGVRRLSSAAPKRGAPVVAPKKLGDDRRRAGKIDVQAALEGEDEKVRSLASVRRQRERERRQAELELLRSDGLKVVREVILPETITVQELANRMAARGNEVVKALMKLGVMAALTQAIDADTAELVVSEFGHKSRRVADHDVLIGLEGDDDVDTDLQPRPPVVTVMGHVDHGKTSLLDALRKTGVAAHEAGGITQHIGAYQVKLPSGAEITFLDTPGHEAFTAMRARGAGVTDIVVLVVAADDGVMPQTIEAIRHAKAAGVPIIVAVNKIDRPGADPNRVRQELLQHEVVVEEMGGETQDVEVSALKKTGLDKLEEAILLQAELLELRANPDRTAEGAIIESRLDKGRGPVATVLVQKGTLHPGDIVVAGAEWGRVRAMQDDNGKAVKSAGPSTPVEILGLSAAPTAGEPFVVVESDTRAREIVEFRSRKARERSAAALTAGRGTMEEMLARIQAGVQKEVAVVIKADVQGSAEAIQVVVTKVGNEEVRVRVLHAAVGQITESDVQLAKASDAIIIAFNVRANSQARELAHRDGVDIRYYSIIYEVADDIEKLVKGKLAPVHREKFLGYAEIRQVFNITKTGKVAGCYVTEGLVKRGSGVRLLRDNVVIHQGELSQLKRFKDDVKEVARGYECGLSFAGFQDLAVGDVVECYETEIVPA